VSGKGQRPYLGESEHDHGCQVIIRPRPNALFGSFDGLMHQAEFC